MRIVKFSLNQFDDKIDTFAERTFSRFKHGSKSAAREFGKLLADGFLRSPEFIMAFESIKSIPLLVSGAPYKFAPTASNALKDYFIRNFNETFVKLTDSSVIDYKTHRDHSYVGNIDYSALATEAERSELIGADNFYIDSKFITDKNIIFIDDIRITGGHESRIISILENAEFKGTVFFVTFAEYVASANPEIESVLNSYGVKDLMDINDIIRNDEFIFNTRVVKFILQSQFEQFKTFILYQSEDFKHQLLHFANGNEYFKPEKYKENYNFLLKNSKR